MGDDWPKGVMVYLTKRYMKSMREGMYVQARLGVRYALKQLEARLETVIVLSVQRVDHGHNLAHSK